MSLMDADDDADFASLVEGFASADGHDSSGAGAPTDGDPHDGGEEDDTDWDALMAAADEAEAEAYNNHQTQFNDAPTQVQSYTQSQSHATQPLTSTQSTKPRTFADCFDPHTLTQTLKPTTLAPVQSLNVARAALPKTATPHRSTAAPTPLATKTSRGVTFGVTQTPTSTQNTSAPVYISEPNDDLRDKISGFKISNRLISSVTLKEKLNGSKVLTLAETLRRSASAPKRTSSESGSYGSSPAGGAFGITGNWVVFGVLTHKSAPRSTASGKGKFSVWTLSDLEGTHATVMLFGKAFESYWQLVEGSVIALANPEDSSGFGKSESSSYSGSTNKGPTLCISIKFNGQILHLGTCPDFGYCKSFKNEIGSYGSQKGMQRCKNVVNLSKGEFCDYHVKSEYKAIMNKRVDLNQSRDARTLQMGASSAPPAKQSLATTKGKPPPGSHAAAVEKMRAAAAQAAKARTQASVKAAPLTAAQQQAKDDRAVAKWDKLTDSTTASSRFMQRVVATQLGQSSSIIASKETGLMSTVERIKQEHLGNATPRPTPTPNKVEPIAKPFDPKDFKYTPKHPLPNHTPNMNTNTNTPTHSSSTPSLSNPSAPSSTHPTTASNQSLASKLRATSNVTAAVTSTTTRTTSTNPWTTNNTNGSNATNTPPTNRTNPNQPAMVKQSPNPTPASASTSRPVSSSNSTSVAPVQSFGSSDSSPSSFLANFSHTVLPAPSVSTSDGAGLVPMLGRGWVNTMNSIQRPTNMNAGERAKQAQRDKQEAMAASLRAAGLLGKPNPNATQAPQAARMAIASSNAGSVRVNGVAIPVVAGVKRKADDIETPKTNYVMHANGGVSLTRPGSSGLVAPNGSTVADEAEARAAAKRNKLAAAFGQSASSTAIDAILARDSKHADLVQESESSRAAQDALFNLMEKKESMALQLNSITHQVVKAYRCLHPGCTVPLSEYPLQACKLKGHRSERCETYKRFFTCQQCKFHISTLSTKLPTHSCHKCGGTVWIKASMMPMVTNNKQHNTNHTNTQRASSHSRPTSRALLIFPLWFSFLLILCFSQKIDSSDRDQLQLRSEETFLRGAF